MFLRCTERKKDGKVHDYYSVVENRRVADNKVTPARCCMSRIRPPRPERHVVVRGGSLQRTFLQVTRRDSNGIPVIDPQTGATLVDSVPVFSSFITPVGADTQALFKRYRR